MSKFTFRVCCSTVGPGIDCNLFSVAEQSQEGGCEEWRLARAVTGLSRPDAAGGAGTQVPAPPDRPIPVRCRVHHPVPVNWSQLPQCCASHRPQCGAHPRSIIHLHTAQSRSSSSSSFPIRCFFFCWRFATRRDPRRRTPASALQASVCRRCRSGE